jgi:small-conductance mechanosensitive channel
MKGLPQKHFLLIVLMAYLAFAAFFAESFIFTHLHHEHDHDSAEGTCSVCNEIELAQFLLEGLGHIGVILCVAGFITHAKKYIKKIVLIYLAAITPVALKVRLNS